MKALGHKTKSYLKQGENSFHWLESYCMYGSFLSLRFLPSCCAYLKLECFGWDRGVGFVERLLDPIMRWVCWKTNLVWSDLAFAEILDGCDGSGCGWHWSVESPWCRVSHPLQFEWWHCQRHPDDEAWSSKTPTGNSFRHSFLVSSVIGNHSHWGKPAVVTNSFPFWF